MAAAKSSSLFYNDGEFSAFGHWAKEERTSDIRGNYEYGSAQWKTR